MSRFLVLLATASLAACGTFRSEAVKTLVAIEAKKVNEATAKAEGLVKDTDKFVKDWRKSSEGLNGPMANVRRLEALQAILRSSDAKLETKIGEEAHAVGYAVGEIFMQEYTGLERAVHDQFEADYKTLRSLATELKDSWAQIATLQGKVKDYAAGSDIADLDVGLITAIAEVSGVDPKIIDNALLRSKQVNDALKAMAGTGLLHPEAVGRAQNVTGDLVELFETLKKN